MEEIKLKDILNKGNGIALICALVTCPHCNKDIWVNIGHHCGYDGVIDSWVKTDCYKCSQSINEIIDMSRYKDMTLMTVSEYTEIEYNGFLENNIN